MSEIATPRQIGAAIREERQRKGLTQQQLADRADVSRGFVNRLEKGSAAAVYPEKLFAVLSALDLRMVLEASEGERASETGESAAPSTGQTTPLASQVARRLGHTAAQALLQQNASIAARMADLGRAANALLAEQLRDSMSSLGNVYANADLPALSPLFATRGDADDPSSEQEA